MPIPVNQDAQQRWGAPPVQLAFGDEAGPLVAVNENNPLPVQAALTVDPGSPLPVLVIDTTQAEVLGSFADPAVVGLPGINNAGLLPVVRGIARFLSGFSKNIGDGDDELQIASQALDGILAILQDVHDASAHAIRTTT